MLEINREVKLEDKNNKGDNFADILSQQLNDYVGKKSSDPKAPVDASNVSKSNEIYPSAKIEEDGSIKFVDLIALGRTDKPYGLGLPENTSGYPKDRETTKGYGLGLPENTSGYPKDRETTKGYGLGLPENTSGYPKDRETTKGYGLGLPVDATGGGKK